MNVHNFKRVMKAIAAAPEWQTEMRTWHNPVTHCGTAHCIAGWCEVEANGENNLSSNAVVTRNRAIGFLGISEEQSGLLFSLFEWPSQFAAKYALNRKAATLERLKHFIETEGRE